MAGLMWTVALGGAAAFLCGCFEKPQTPPASSDKRPDNWVVFGHRAPGVSAMSDAEAAAWHGRTIHFGTREAVSGTYMEIGRASCRERV